jgi:biotin carboxyl carrier protein
MPGLLKAINVTIGQTVKKGEVIFVLEAMKMENALKSPMNGIIKEIYAEAGSAIEKGFVLCTIGPIE